MTWASHGQKGRRMAGKEAGFQSQTDRHQMGNKLIKVFPLVLVLVLALQLITRTGQATGIV